MFRTISIYFILINNCFFCCLKPIDGLRGKTLIVVINGDTSEYSVKFSDSSKSVPESGIMVDLMNEIQRQGNFNIKYVITPPIREIARTTDEYYRTIVPYVDLFIGKNLWIIIFKIVSRYINDEYI